MYFKNAQNLFMWLYHKFKNLFWLSAVWTFYQAIQLNAWALGQSDAIFNIRAAVFFQRGSDGLIFDFLCYGVCAYRYITCNLSDLAPECPNPHDQRYQPERILIYDEHPGGSGLSLQVIDIKLQCEDVVNTLLLLHF